jgi:hypothetical protein
MWTSFCFSLSLQAGDGDAGPGGDDLGDVLVGDFLAQQRAPGGSGLRRGPRRVRFLRAGDESVLDFAGAGEVAATLGLFEFDAQGLDFGFQLAAVFDERLFVLPAGVEKPSLSARRSAISFSILASSFERGRVAFLFQHLAFHFALHDLALELVEFGGLGFEFDLQARAGLIDQVDRLVGQEAVGDVAVGEGGGGDQRGVGDAHAMVDLVAFLDAAQDRDGVLDAGFADHHRLEAALERGVLFDVLAVFVERGGADGAQFAAGELGFEQVAGIDRALGGARADDGVQLVDEQNDAALGIGHFLEECLEAVFEFAAVFGTGDHGAEVHGDDPFVLERIGHVAGDDAAGEAFDDGGFADAGLADEHRVVFGAAGKHLHHPADFLVAADHRVEFAGAGGGGEVGAVFFERLELALGLGVGDALGAADGGQGFDQPGLGQAGLAEDLAGRAGAVGHRQQ